jgi:hypothetical protein
MATSRARLKNRFAGRALRVRDCLSANSDTVRIKHGLKLSRVVLLSDRRTAATLAEMKLLTRQRNLSVSLGSASAATRGFVGSVLLDSEEKIRMGGHVRYTGCCM